MSLPSFFSSRPGISFFLNFQIFRAIGFYAKTRGWPFVIAWTHRITGTILVLYAWIHIYTLSLLERPGEYDAKINFLPFFIVGFLEWLLAIPVIFHALNGGRLILYESFGTRNDDTIIRWVLSLSTIYILFSGLIMVMGNQAVSLVFYWLFILIISACVCYIAASKILSGGMSVFWKLQRITGAFLLVMIPAHLLFMHINPSVSHNAGIVITRMNNDFIKIVDVALVLGVMYHSGYGLFSIAGDYIRSPRFKTVCALLIFAVTAASAWFGVRLVLFI